MSTTPSSKTVTPASSPAQFLTSDDLAARLGVPQRTVTLWCRSGRLPAVRPGKAWLIHARSLVELEAQAAAEAGGRRQGGTS